MGGGRRGSSQMPASGSRSASGGEVREPSRWCARSPNERPVAGLRDPRGIEDPAVAVELVLVRPVAEPDRYGWPGNRATIRERSLACRAAGGTTRPGRRGWSSRVAWINQGQEPAGIVGLAEGDEGGDADAGIMGQAQR